MPVNFEKRPEPSCFTSPVAPLLQEIKQVLLAMFFAAAAVAYALMILVFFLPGGLDTWNSPANKPEVVPTQYAPSQELPVVRPRVKQPDLRRPEPRDTPIRRLR